MSEQKREVEETACGDSGTLYVTRSQALDLAGKAGQISGATSAVKDGGK